MMRLAQSANSVYFLFITMAPHSLRSGRERARFKIRFQTFHAAKISQQSRSKSRRVYYKTILEAWGSLNNLPIVTLPVMRATSETSKQTECGHLIGCALVKHKVLLTVDMVLLFTVIYVLSDAMQKIAQKSHFTWPRLWCTMIEVYSAIVYKFPCSSPAGRPSQWR